MGTEDLARAFTITSGILRAVTPEQLAAPTPCASWDVRALVNHIVRASHWFPATVISGVAAEIPATDYTTGDVAASYDDGIEASLDAFDTPGALEKPIRLPFGEFPGIMYLGLATSDTFVHGWDLAKATGQRTDLDSALALRLLEQAQQVIPDQFPRAGRAGAVRSGRRRRVVGARRRPPRRLPRPHPLSPPRSAGRHGRRRPWRAGSRVRASAARTRSSASSAAARASSARVCAAWACAAVCATLARARSNARSTSRRCAVAASARSTALASSDTAVFLAAVCAVAWRRASASARRATSGPVVAFACGRWRAGRGGERPEAGGGSERSGESTGPQVGAAVRVVGGGIERGRDAGPVRGRCRGPAAQHGDPGVGEPVEPLAAGPCGVAECGRPDARPDGRLGVDDAPGGVEQRGHLVGVAPGQLVARPRGQVRSASAPHLDRGGRLAGITQLPLEAGPHQHELLGCGAVELGQGPFQGRRRRRADHRCSLPDAAGSMTAPPPPSSGEASLTWTDRRLRSRQGSRRGGTPEVAST